MTEKKGYFFLPENLNNNDRYIPGIITIGTSKPVEITLFDSLKEPEHPFDFGEIETTFTIWGILETGEAVSLLTARFSGGTKPLSGSGIPSVKYKAKHCILKAHIADTKEKKFFKAIFSISKFQRWHSKFGGQSQIETNTKGHTESFKFEYHFPTVLAYQIEENYNLRISFTVNHPHQFGEYSLKQITEIIIESEEDESLHTYLEKIVQFKNLFSIILGESAIINALAFNDKGIFYENAEFNIPKQYSKINYHSEIVSTMEAGDSDPRSYSVTFSAIEPIYENVLNTWYKKNQLIAFRNIVSICVDSLKADSKFHPTQFIAMFQAIEGFHRNFFPKETDAILKDKAIFEAILVKNLTQEEKDWLNEKFKTGFEVSARQRLNSLLNKYGHILSPSLPKKYYKKVVNDILQKRNKLTHMDDNYNVSNFLDVYHAYHHLLQRLLMLLILDEVGIDEKIINKDYFRAMEFNLKYYDNGCRN